MEPELTWRYEEDMLVFAIPFDGRLTVGFGVSEGQYRILFDGRGPEVRINRHLLDDRKWHVSWRPVGSRIWKGDWILE